MRKIKHGRLAGGCSDACCLKLEGLSVHIQGEDILEDVSFHLHCGEIAALIGPNGAGKSSLFRSILGQMPYSGTITFSPAGGPAVRLSDGANAPLAARGTRPLIGYVPQSPSFDRGDPISVLDFFTAARLLGETGANSIAAAHPEAQSARERDRIRAQIVRDILGRERRVREDRSPAEGRENQ